MKYGKYVWGQRLIILILLASSLLFAGTTYLANDRLCNTKLENENLKFEATEMQQTIENLRGQIKKLFEPLPIEITPQNEVLLLDETGKSTSTVLLPSNEVKYSTSEANGGTFSAASYDMYGVVWDGPVDWEKVDSLVAMAHEKAVNGYPQLYNHMWRTGQQLERMYSGLDFEAYPMDSTYAAASEVIYQGYCWDDALSYYANRYTPWIGRGEWVVRNLIPHGLEWEFAMAALYAESEWGCNTRAVAFGNAATLQGYINLVLTYPAPNDIYLFVKEWHMPENFDIFLTNFGTVVTWLRNWRP